MSHQECRLFFFLLRYLMLSSNLLYSVIRTKTRHGVVETRIYLYNIYYSYCGRGNKRFQRDLMDFHRIFVMTTDRENTARIHQNWRHNMFRRWRRQVVKSRNMSQDWATGRCDVSCWKCCRYMPATAARWT